MTRWLRRVALAVVVVLALVALMAGGVALWLRSALPDYEREITLSGLDGDVRIAFDELGIPHIFAGSEHDLLFAQGWVHAQDRLWQLELFRRVAEGRLAEALGADLVDSDRFLRTVGVWRAAANAEARLEPDVRERLQAYVDGVNAYLERRDGALPPEFVLLRIEPGPWTVRHTLAIEKLMAWDLSSYSMEIDAARAFFRFGAERAGYLVPAYPGWGTTILPDAGVPAAVAGADFAASGVRRQASETAGWPVQGNHPHTVADARSLTPDAPFGDPIPAAARMLLESLNTRQASNAWVIGGERTASGRPILANDMHLALRAPGVWYLVGLHGGGYDVAGMSIPGAPFVVAGHNRVVAWGFTNAMTDDADLFIERLDPADATRYLTPGGSEPFAIVVDTIRVKGGEPVAFRSRWTRNGPVISDVTGGLGADPVTLRWAAHDDTHAVAALPLMNRARSAAEFRAALRFFDNPHQNVVFADTAGDFGYHMSGHVPIRGAFNMPPRFPVPGWTGDWDWTGRMPFDQHPHADASVAAGYVVTANNRQVAGPEGEFVSAIWEQPFRAARITQMIEQAAALLTTRDVHRMQLDVLDLHALRYRDRAIAAARAANVPDFADAIAGWDARATTDSRPGALWYAWYHRMRALAGRDFWREDHALPRAALDNVLELRALPWRDDGAAAFDRLAREAVDWAVEHVAGRAWGDLHRGVIVHPLGEVAWLDRLLGLNVGPHPLAGSSTTVNVSQWLETSFPVNAAYGPSQRHVVDLADVDGAGGFVLPAGQSGIPFSRHYDDMHDAWVDGGLWRIPVDPAAAEARATAVTTLRAD
ncbi:MAG TPA: penicillin acylase family protein [Longimicrobiales bacterium]